MTTLASLARRFPSAARADFRWYWLGMFFYSFGMQSRVVIGGWLIYKLTGSALSLGWYIGTWGLAAFLLSFVGGTLSDRLNLRSVLIASRAVAAAALFALYLLVLGNRLTFWQLLLFSFANGMVVSFEYPARTAIVPKIIPPTELTSGFGLSYTAQNLASIIGPALVGPIIDHVGVDAAILVTGTIVLFSSFSSLPIPSAPCAPSATARRGTVWRGVLDGLQHVRAEQALLAVEAFLLAYVLLVMPYRDMLPAVAADVLHVGATGLGFLSAAASSGALLGTIILSSLGEVRPRGLFLLGAALLDSVGLIFFSQSRVLGLSLLLLAAAGIGYGFFIPLSNTLLQAYANPEMRARVIGMNMFVWSLSPLGSILVGAVADRLGPGTGILISAAIATVVFLYGVSLSPRTRNLA